MLVRLTQRAFHINVAEKLRTDLSILVEGCRFSTFVLQKTLQRDYLNMKLSISYLDTGKNKLRIEWSSRNAVYKNF